MSENFTVWLDSLYKNRQTRNMENITKQTVGENRTLIKIDADNRQQVIQTLWKFINAGRAVCLRKGCEIEDHTPLVFLNVLESSGYITVDTQEFIKTLQAIELNKIAINTQHESHVSQKMKDRANILGQKMWENIEETNIFKDSAETEYILTAD